MDIELARTFLAIVETGSFARAADRLNVTQTAVSARIKSLEEQLGRPLFIRNKAGASLAPAGEQFLRFAPTFLQVWERARHQVGVPPGHRSVLALGGELSLWKPMLLSWMLWMRRTAPDIALRAQVGLPDELLRQVGDGTLDLAVVYAPIYWPGLEVEMICEERLLLVTADPKIVDVCDPGYVYVDWGAGFAAHHRVSFPHFGSPGVFVGLYQSALALTSPGDSQRAEVPIRSRQASSCRTEATDGRSSDGHTNRPLGCGASIDCRQVPGRGAGSPTPGACVGSG